MLGVLYVLVLPRPGTKIDYNAARAIVKAQWKVPLLVFTLTPLFTGMVAPAVRAAIAGARLSPGRALIAAGRVAPAVALHVAAAHALVLLGLVAGIVPGVLAMPIAAMCGAAVAGNLRGRAAFDTTSAAIAPRRWRAAGLVAALMAVEVGLTIATWKLLVPPLNKKSPAAVLVATTHFAWINAVRVAITSPLAAIQLATLYGVWSSDRRAPAP